MFEWKKDFCSPQDPKGKWGSSKNPQNPKGEPGSPKEPPQARGVGTPPI